MLKFTGKTLFYRYFLSLQSNSISLALKGDFKLMVNMLDVSNIKILPHNLAAAAVPFFLIHLAQAQRKNLLSASKGEQSADMPQRA